MEFFGKQLLWLLLRISNIRNTGKKKKKNQQTVPKYFFLTLIALSVGWNAQSLNCRRWNSTPLGLFSVAQQWLLLIVLNSTKSRRKEGPTQHYRKYKTTNPWAELSLNELLIKSRGYRILPFYVNQLINIRLTQTQKLYYFYQPYKRRELLLMTNNKDEKRPSTMLILTCKLYIFTSRKWTNYASW